ncbi:DNA-binding transcriptional LysR family regulator [Sphingobium sp. B2D3A]|uniref:LysR family transcriptional regulator n=1 Tax=unclassified Sphingobium TaxID=2611147 RepID=UPI002225A87A|nr:MULTISPECIES: LysR family transcriptional regulator [unclassified Sphingobium]MCW2336122.1 DNA-binding transcriptional LysR family regulator [Sphingobium sp. B2D3A]MCW2380458.1 DNA-binding transcriptional LysR family regulator [Sphingobium sp. B2D3B]MCW2385877.1 DNA-binding transcriptional LysR family regulator [Sphingobium sp. B2D3D]MCW2389379.1 DNA-binding transcriptional LysR family regulator [Sphingobium sp. B11D3B]MCW2395941.1 DNA-binding transcriptional LysR family regulator [Sphingob
MDTLLNMRAFLAVVECGSLAAAARKLNIAPSVMSKRIGRLEDELGAVLFVRTPRKAELTAFGERQLPRVRALVRQTDDVVAGARRSRQALDGHLRIKCPTTVASSYFGRFFADFVQSHVGVSIDLMLVDRSVNPIEEGFDLAIGAMAASYAGVMDVPLCEHPMVICAAPSYLARRGHPKHPRELVEHDCLNSQSIGGTWVFESESGDLAVDVSSRFAVNTAIVLRDAALRGAGIVMLSEFVSREAVRAGRLVQLLPDFPVKSLWLKALVPNVKMSLPLVQALIEDLLAFTQPVAPWDRADPAN